MQRKNNQQIHFELTSRFKKELRQSSVEIQIAFRDSYEIFRDDPVSKVLGNHPLNKQRKRYHGLWSIDVTSDWRAVYRKEGDHIIFMMLRTHEMLYGLTSKKVTT